MTFYDESQFEVNTHKVHLKDESGRTIPFLLSLTRKSVPFCVLSRYLVLNLVTGMLHLYQFEQSKEQDIRKGLFAFHNDLKCQMKRDDTPRYLHHYFERALKTIGEPKKMIELTPLQLLVAMREYWHLTACAQDTLAICLEVQQLFLYVKLYRELVQWKQKLPKLRLISNDWHHNDLLILKDEILYGTSHTEETDCSRIFFIDILARRLLLVACVKWFQRTYPEEMGVYADLMVDSLVVDEWSGIEFGNIEEGDYEAPGENLLTLSSQF